MKKKNTFADKFPVNTSFLAKDSDLAKKIQMTSIAAHKLMKFKDFSMFDIRLDSDDNVYILEVNLFCSFGPASALNTHAIQAGYDDKAIFDIMSNNVLQRC